MHLARRLSIIAPGGALVVSVGVLAACLSVGSFLQNAGPHAIAVFVFSVPFAPLFLAVPWLRDWAWANLGSTVPTATLVLALVAIVAVPAHPILARRWAAAVTIVGLALWLACELIVAGGPA